MMRRNTTLTAVLAAGLLALSVGCADEVGDIDRTQPNKLEKASLAGSWYMLQTMVDVPQQTAAGFIGNTNFGGNAKIMFEVTEKWLYIVPVTETVQFSEAPYKLKKVRNYWEEGKSNEFVEMWVGQPIAIFPIESHFDIQREYNAQTGQQSNVIVENTTDKKWHERKYMRVNWGANALIDWSFPRGTTPIQPVDHYVQEVEDPYLKPDGAGANPDLPEFDEGYISFVTKGFVPPSERDWQGNACNPFGLSNKDCAGAVIKLRWSFKKADPTPDYQTLVYKNSEHMDKFGFFLADRYAYDDLYNLTESGRDYKAQRWNLWDTTWDHYEDIVDEAGNAVQCRFHHECGADETVLDTEARRCVKEHHFELGTCKKARLKQFKDRGLKPVIYHLNASIPEQVRGQFYRSADEWSQVFRTTVAWNLALEELGRYWTKSCNVDTDCTAGRGDVLLDASIDVVQTEQQGVACDVQTNPCAKNQLCSGGLCFVKNADGSKGEQVTVSVPAAVASRKVTAVVYPGAEGLAVAKVRDVPVAYQAGKAGIRFVNAKVDSTVDLTAGSATVASQVPFIGDAWVEDFHYVDGGSVTLSAGGASAQASLAVGRVYTVVLTSAGLVVAENPNATKDGLRVLNATGQGALDFGVNTIRAASALEDGQLSSYAPNNLDQARITALAIGAQGDVNCYYTLHEGRCVGWAGDYEAADNKFKEKLQQIPDMFVVCENTYETSLEQANYEHAVSQRQQADAQGIDAVIHHDGRYSTQGRNPYAVAGEQDLEDPNAFFNPCKDLVPEPESLKKIGDVRYNFIYWVGENQAASPLGYGPSAGDPETGELIWGTAYVYGAPTLTYGQSAADMVDLVNGVLDDSDIVSGKYIKDYVERKGDPLPWDNSATMYHGGLQHDDHALDLRVGHKHPQMDKFGMVNAGTYDPARITELTDFMTNAAYRKQLFSKLPTVSSDYTKNRMERLRGTVIEDMLINNEVKMAFGGPGLDPGQALNAELREKLSPVTWGTAAAATDTRAHNLALAKAPCSYEREFVDDNIYGLAKEFFCTPEELQQYQAGTLQGKECKSGDELRWVITNRILSGLIEHEVGHTVGLRHNFAGSADLFNFKDEYFQVREKEFVYCKDNAHCDEDGGEVCNLGVSCVTDTDCAPGLSCSGGSCMDGAGEITGLCNETDANGQLTGPVSKFAPRSYMTEQERLNKMSEYQYSTVMDYGGTFNSDVHGLGKYDYAAIKFAYGGMVDVYSDPKNLVDRMNHLAKITGRDPSIYASVLDPSFWRYAGVTTSPFLYLEDYIGVEENLRRSTVTYEQVKLEHAMQENYDHQELYWTHVEVPYRFCSDEFRGNLGCYTWDTGVDVGEMVANAVGKINEYYVFDAFKRESMFRGSGSFIGSYFSRVLTRYMNILADAGRYFAIYENIFQDRPWYQDWKQNLYGMGVIAQAAETSFNQLAQILATPAPGGFMKDNDNVYRNVNYDVSDPNADLTIPVGVGKFPYTQYIESTHYGFENHVLWVGSYWLKYAALLTLTDSTFYSSSDWVGEQLEIGRSTAVGFNTLYQREMTNLIGGIVAESLDSYSGVIDFDSTGKPFYRSRDLFNPDLDSGKDVIEPGLNNLTLKLQAAVFGMVNLPAGFDPSFTDSMAVFLKGQGHEYDLTGAGGAGVQVAEFQDPFGGKTYVAYTPNYDPERMSPAFEVVKRAQQVREQWEQASGAQKVELERTLKKNIEVLDILKRLHTLYGNLVY